MKKIIAILFACVWFVLAYISKQKSEAAHNAGPWYLAFVLAFIGLVWTGGWLVAQVGRSKKPPVTPNEPQDRGNKTE
jgi:H+/Cl- antiporter ClcA